jgi:hypothetical protein
VAMQSSTTVACRAGVILVCLVAIPLAALFGTKVPALVAQLLSRDWHLGVDLGLLTGESPPGDATPAGPETCESPWSRSDGAANLGGRLNQSSVHPLPSNGPTGEVFAGYEAPVGEAPTARLANWQEGAGSLGVDSGSPQGLPVDVGTSFSPGFPPAVPGSPRTLLATVASGAATGQRETNPPCEGRSASPGGEPDSSRTPRGPLPGTEQMAALEQKLRGQGATYYALETWGAAGQYYRFHAKMAVDGDPSCARHFEAVRDDAVQAMASVLEQVERWRAAQQPRNLPE